MTTPSESAHTDNVTPLSADQLQRSLTQAWALLAPYGLNPELLPVTVETGAVQGGLLAVLRGTEACSDEDGLPTPRRITVSDVLPQLLEAQDLEDQLEQILLDALLHELGHALDGWAMDVMMHSGELLCDLNVDDLRALDPGSDQSDEEVFVESLALHLSGTRPGPEPMKGWFAAWLRQCASDLRFAKGLAS